jgi:arylsulfatase A-like enzyme
MAVAWLLIAGGLARADDPRPPNVVLMLIDDLGWRDLSCYGSTFYETPHIDRLAREGMRFTNAYASCPVCSPTRAALLTGKCPERLHFTGHITSIRRHRHPKDSRIIPPDDLMYLPHEEVTIAESLRPAGFVSASIGKWHVGHVGYWPTDQGFNLNVAGSTDGSPPGYFFPYTKPERKWNASIPTLHGGEPGEYLTDRLTDEAIRFIEAHRDRPFFVYLPHFAVHTPIEAPAELVPKYEKKMHTDQSQINPTYAAMIESVDRNVDRVLRTLDRLDLAADTLVIFTSDNGGASRVTRNAPLRAGKGHLYEGGIRVPMIVRFPGKIAAGTTCDTPVISHDFEPTIREFVGRKETSRTPRDGVSLAGVLTGRGEPQREALYWYYPHYPPQGARPGAAMRSGAFKLIEHYDPPAVELYNLQEDIGERKDLAKSMPERVERMRRSLRDHLTAVGTILHTPNDRTGRP